MIRKYDSTKKKWVVLGSGNANSIALDNPEYASESGDPISVAEGFEKVADEIDTIKKNISYIYKNGTIGGGGGSTSGSGSSSSSTDAITVTDEGITISGSKNFLYIGSDSANVTFYIKTSGTTSKYSVTAKLDNKTISGWESVTVYSSKNGSTAKTISISGITGNATLVISAVDSNGVELDSYTLFIRVGSYSFTMEGQSSVFTTYYNDIDSQNFRFYVKNAIPGSTAYLNISCNSVVSYTEGVDYVTSNSWDRTVYFGNLLKAAGISNPEVGAEYKISASLELQSSSLAAPIESEPIEFTVFIADSNALTLMITGNNIYSQGTDESSMKSQPQDDNISISIQITDNNYSLFNLAYQIVDAEGNIFYIGNWNDITADENDRVLTGVTKQRQFNPVNLGMSTGVYQITIKAAANSRPDYYGTKVILGKLVKSENIWVGDYNPNQRMIAQYSTYVSLKNPQDSVWKSTSTDSGEGLYPLAGDTDTLGLRAARTLEIFSTNGQTSGFITSDLTENSPALRLSGKAYGLIRFAPFAQNSVTGKGYYTGKIQSNNGFCISITFRSDNHPNSNGTILDIGDYTTDTKELSRGLHIGLNEVVYKFEDQGNVQNISTTIIQNELNTIDLVYEIEGSGANRTAGLKLYHNGVCSAAYFFNSLEDPSLVCSSKIWLGTRNTQAAGSESAALNDNYCDVNIYDFKIYASSLNAYGIVRNYINAKSRAELVDGNLNWTMIRNLRTNNFLEVSKISGTDTYTLSCELCDASNDFDNTWSGLYDQLKSRSNNPIPILLVTVTDGGFYQTYHKKYSTTELENLSLTSFGATYTYTDTTGQSITINTTSEQVSGTTSTSPYITLQGTTTMGYAAKNLELYMGTVDGTNGRLFTPKKNSWLPENRFTLKADVVDSAHCNNASIGKFMNNSGVFGDIPPQTLSSNKYAGMVKHTLEGFPVYLFVQYSSNDTEAVEALGNTINTPQFMGIYSFNLGRGSYFNMGFKVLSSYVLSDTESTTDSPSLVNSYVVLSDPYQGGCFSYEFNQNNNEYGSFQQDDAGLIEMFCDKKYPESTTSTDNYGFKSLQFLFTILANCYDGDGPNKYIATQNENGETFVQKTDDTYNDASTYYTSTYVINRKFSWKNANAYFLLAMALGMVDSLGKNMTLRTWNSNSPDSGAGMWYTCFYDMDTCLGLNNYGSQVVGKDVSLNKYENVNTSGITAVKVTENYTDYGSAGYSTYNSRLWNVVTKGILAKDGNIEIGEDGSFRTMWIEWRKNPEIFETYENFVENYYKSQISSIGEIMFNLDYKIKYFDPYNTFVTENGITSRKDTESISFLHGRRIEYVTDWLKDRLGFLDAIFLYDYSGKSTANIGDSQYLTKVSMRGSGQSGVPSICLGITVSAPNILEYTVNNSTTRAILAEDEKTEVWVPMADGDTQATMNLPSIISSIDGFSSGCWSSLTEFKLTNLETFDLSGMSTLSEDSSLGKTTDSIISYMTELRELELKNLKVKKFISGIPVVCTNCTKLRTIDISGSDVSSLNLPVGGCLEELNISGSKISSITITSQPFLDNIDFSNCTYLTSVIIKDCESLTTLNLDNTSVQTIDITNCTALKSLSAKSCSSLQTVRTDSCQALTSIDLTNSGISIDDPENVTLNFLGANALETLTLSGTNSTRIALNENAKSTLSYVNIAKSSIYKIQFGSLSNSIPALSDYPITDFSGFSKLTDSGKLVVNTNPKIKYLLVNENTQASYFNITSSSWLSGCTLLTRVLGHIRLSASGIFSSLTGFYLNNQDTYLNASVSDGSGQKLSGSNGDNSAFMPSFRTVWLKNSDSPDKYSTNVDIATTSLSSAFAWTSVNIYDVYYILSRCQKDSNTASFSQADVTNLSSTFYLCRSIVTNDSNPLGRYTFMYCPEVTNMNSIFSGSGNLKGPLFSPTIAFGESGEYDGLLSPLKKLTECGYAFYGSGIQWIDSYFYYKLSDTEYLGCTSLASAAGGSSTKSVVQAGVDNTSSPLLSSVWLENLPNLTSTYFLFYQGGSGVTFKFETVTDETTGKEVTLFLHNNPNVTNVSNTFAADYNSYVISGRITGGIFGGSCGGKVTWTDSSEVSHSYSGFPKNITNFSRFLCSRNGNSTVQLDWSDMNDLFASQNKTEITSVEYMWGRFGVDNQIRKGYAADGTKNSTLPTKIFDGLSAVTSVAGFFNDHGVKNSKDNPLELPGTMFNTCKSLTNIYAVFANSSVPTDFHVKLSSLGFRNCQLQNVAYSFCRVGKLGDSTDEYSGIPLRFFYMDYDSDPISIPYGPDKKALGKSTFTRKVVRNTITTFDYAFYGNSTFGANSVQYSTSDNGCILDENGKCGDLVWNNLAYDPRTMILKDSSKAWDETTNPYIPNPDYSPEPYAWDSWAWDGVYRELLEPTDIEEAGAVYIDPNQAVNSYEALEEIDLSGYSVKILNSEGSEITVDELDLSYLWDGSAEIGTILLPKDQYIVFDFSESGLNIENLKLWNNGISRSKNIVISVYGEVPDQGVYQGQVDLGNLSSIAVVSDTIDTNSYVISNTWTATGTDPGYIELSKVGCYRYLVLWNGIDEDEDALCPSLLEITARVTKNNVQNECVAKYGPIPDTFNTEADQKFIGGRLVTSEINLASGTSGGVATYGACFNNFLVPSDLFRFCAFNCTVTYALAGLGSNVADKNESGIGLLRGRLQPELLSRLSATTSLAGLFSECHYILTPYVPHYQESGSKYYGQMFPSALFANCAKVSDITEIFSYIHVPRNIRLCSSTLFKGFGNSLSNVSKAFYYSVWGGGDSLATGATDITVLDQFGTPFGKNPYVQTANYLLQTADKNSNSRSPLQITDGCSKSLKALSKNMFKAGYHTTLRYVNYMMCGNDGIYTAVPELWNFGTILEKDQCYTFCSNATNVKDGTAKNYGYSRN